MIHDLMMFFKDDEQDLSIAHEDSMNQPADSSSHRKAPLTSMINNFVNSLKTTSSRDPKEKGEFLEKIDQKIREGMGKYRSHHSVY